MTAEQRLVEEFIGTHPAEAARFLDRANVVDVVAVLETLGPEAARLLRQLSPVRAVACLERVDPARAAAWLAGVPVEIVAVLLRRLPPQDADAILERLPTQHASAARLLRAWPPHTAGAAMDPLVQVVPLSGTVDDALALLRLAPAHVYYYVYAIDDGHRLAGAVDLAELMQATGSARLATVVRRDVIRLQADMPLPNVLAHPAWLRLDALPVTDRDGVFLGIIRHRALRQYERAEHASDRATHPLDTLFSLGEIYWLGLSGLLQGFARADAALLPAGGKEVHP